MHIQVESKAVRYTITVSYYIDQVDYVFVQFSKTLIRGFVLFINKRGFIIIVCIIIKIKLPRARTAHELCCSAIL